MRNQSSSRNLKVNIIIALIFMSFFIGIFSIGSYALNRIEQQTRINVRDNLQTVLRTTYEAMYIWLEHRSYMLEEISKSPELIRLTEELLLLLPDRENLLVSESLKEIRLFFDPLLEKSGDLGIFIISPDKISLASMRDNNTGTLNLIDSQRGNLLDKVFDGETLFIPTIRSDVPLPGHSERPTENIPTLFVAGPIKDESGEIIAALAIRLDPEKDFTRIAQLGRIGESGETYAFDENAILISEIRFENQMRSLGLIKPDERAILTIRITDPGVNLMEGFHTDWEKKEMPLTKMAEDATKGNSGFNIMGYRDYRGVEVFGVWIWDEKLGFGLATEIDAQDALKSFFETRIIVIGVLIFTTLLALILSAIIILIYRQSDLKLQNAYNHLEEMVRIRTVDLEEARIELSVANRELQELATIDSLTGLLNRRSLDMFLESEWNRCIREEKSISFAMFDLDYFKILNDTYGHQTGDDCLKKIGYLLKNNRFLSRPGDLIARYGGEEFAFVLSDTNLSKAFEILEKVMKAVTEEKIPNENSKVKDCDYVTASIGLASEIPQQDSSPKQLIAKADEALYNAKSKGRNRIEMFE